MTSRAYRPGRPSGWGGLRVCQGRPKERLVHRVTSRAAYKPPRLSYLRHQPWRALHSLHLLLPPTFRCRRHSLLPLQRHLHLRDRSQQYGAVRNSLAFGGCVVLPVLLVIGFVGCLALVGGGGGEGGSGSGESRERKAQQAAVDIGQPVHVGEVTWTVTNAR